jgi:hypothetical protein
MTPFRRPAAWLFAVGLLLPALPARAGQADKYLPHDTDFVLIVNVKQIRSWPPFQEKVRGPVEKLLQAKEVKQVLEGTGLDPLKDLDRVVIVQAISSAFVKQAGTRTSIGSGPSFALLEGRFDRQKLLARAEQAARDMPKQVTLHKVGKAQLVEIRTGGDRELFAALLDDGTLMLSTIKSQADEALQRAAGKNTTRLKSGQIRELLAKADGKRAVQWLADGDMVTGMSVSSRTDANGKTVTNTRKFTLRQEGIETFDGGISLVKTDLRLRMTLKAADKEKAEGLAGKWQNGLKQAIKEVEAFAEKDRSLGPLVLALMTGHIAAKGDTVLVEGRGPADAAVAAIRAFYELVRPRRPAGPPAEPKVEDTPVKKG